MCLTPVAVAGRLDLGRIPGGKRLRLVDSRLQIIAGKVRAETRTESFCQSTLSRCSYRLSPLYTTDNNCCCCHQRCRRSPLIPLVRRPCECTSAAPTSGDMRRQPRHARAKTSHRAPEDGPNELSGAFHKLLLAAVHRPLARVNDRSTATQAVRRFQMTYIGRLMSATVASSERAASDPRVDTSYNSGSEVFESVGNGPESCGALRSR
jgi:hypothetical protein